MQVCVQLEEFNKQLGGGGGGDLTALSPFYPHLGFDLLAWPLQKGGGFVRCCVRLYAPSGTWQFLSKYCVVHID